MTNKKQNKMTINITVINYNVLQSCHISQYYLCSPTKLDATRHFPKFGLGQLTNTVDASDASGRFLLANSHKVHKTDAGKTTEATECLCLMKDDDRNVACVLLGNFLRLLRRQA